MEEDQQVSLRVIEDEMKDAYMSYAMSVIVGRALPDVRDGLKPVHRRILYAMQDTGMRHTSAHKKSARIVGEVLGKYHPHGDSAVYDTIVRMVQEWSLRYPLIDGQGNFGSIDGDNAAAMRYCVTGDTRVLTDRGMEKIQDVSDAEDIDRTVLSFGQKRNAASKLFDSGKHPTIEIETNNGLRLQGTENHPILVVKTDTEGLPFYAWKLLRDIKDGDVAVIDRSPGFWPRVNVPLTTADLERNHSLPTQVEEDLAFVLGALTAEGTITDNKVEFCNTDKQYLQHFKSAWERVFPTVTLHEFEREPSSYGKKAYWRLEAHSPAATQTMRRAGLKPVPSAERRVPETILRSPKTVAAAFLAGYFEGDGSVSQSSKMRELSCCSTSEELIEELQQLLLRFGILATKRYDEHRDTHKLYLRSYRNMYLFDRDIGFISDRKEMTLKGILAEYKKDMSITDKIPHMADFIRNLVPDDAAGKRYLDRFNFDRYSTLEQRKETVQQVLAKEGLDFSSAFERILQQHYAYDEIVSVEQAETARVYSFKVDSECHSYVGNGFVNHNTEARLDRISQELLEDLDKDTVEWTDNFDGSLQEPLVLPAKLPNLLLNGSSGIAVGMATNIPPHNLTEVCNALTAYLEDPDLTVPDLMEHLPGPDFPTGAQICGRAGILQAYRTGRGKVITRGVIEREDDDAKLIITEIPYQVVKSKLIEKIADLVRNDRIEGIRDIRDESDRKGMRVVITLKNNASADIVENKLFKYTRLQQTFGVNTVAIVDGEPQTLTLPELLHHHLSHRREVITRRTQYLLDKAEDRAHILEGLLVALTEIDDVVPLIKESADVETARESLMQDYELSEEQADAILSLQLQKLTGLEQDKIKDEHEELTEQIKDYKDILDKPERVDEIIKEDLQRLKETYGDERRTEITEQELGIDVEDLIDEEDMVVTISHDGYVKRLSVDTYRAQHRGGKGIIGATTKEGDFVEHLFVANTHSHLLFFTDKGEVYWKKVYRIPETSRTAKGTYIKNLLEIGDDEHISAVIPVSEFTEDEMLVFATRKGRVKKTALEAYSRPRTGGIHAIKLEDGDDVVRVVRTSGDDEVFMASKHGQAIRFHESDVREMGRYTRGVIGMRLKGDDEVVSLCHPEEGKTVLSVTENGYGKRTPLSKYRLQGRGGFGVRNIVTSERNGSVAAVRMVDGDEDLLLISSNGIIIRTKAEEISTYGRSTQGVRVMKLRDGDSVAAVAKVVETDA